MSEALLPPPVVTSRIGAAPKGMVRVPGGTVRMGSADFYPEEQPVVPVAVDPFWMDAHPVTVAEFRRFVKATDYVTLAERTPDAADYPGAEPSALVPGALVFHMTSGPVDLRNWREWWSYVPGASWRHPRGQESTLDGKEKHPVTQVAYEDAAAYASWAGKALPTEAEWEAGARGGLDGAVFAWGEEFMPKGRPMANTWHGDFPWQHHTPGLAGRPGTTPVGTYPPNGYGLHDMTGNVWEWTADYFAHTRSDAEPSPSSSCCSPHKPAAPDPADGELFARRVTKGGSHLCAPNYCLRYRPAARQGQAEDTATCHLGFRCVVRD